MSHLQHRLDFWRVFDALQSNPYSLTADAKSALDQQVYIIHWYSKLLRQDAIHRFFGHIRQSEIAT